MSNIEIINFSRVGGVSIPMRGWDCEDEKEECSTATFACSDAILSRLKAYEWD